MRFVFNFSFLTIFLALCCSCVKSGHRLRAESPTPENQASVAELLDAITIRASDLDTELILSKEKQKSINKASSALRDIGLPVVPKLVEMAKLTYKSQAHESLTGSNACKILITIGRPVIPYIKEAKLGVLGENLIKNIENNEDNQQIDVSKRPEFFSDEWPIGSPSSYVERKELIDNCTLYDGMTRAEAEAILGKATGEKNGLLDWYHNPGNRLHVAAFFRAELRNGKLYNWQTGNR